MSAFGRLPRGEQSAAFTGHSGPVWVVAFTRDGKVLASGSQDGTVRLWEVSTGRQLRVIAGHRASISSLGFSPDNQLLASGSLDATALVWDVGACTANAKPGRNKLSRNELELLWAELQAEDPAKAYVAIRQLAAHPEIVCRFCRSSSSWPTNRRSSCILTEQRIDELIAESR